jgi:hypothetical protein
MTRWLIGLGAGLFVLGAMGMRTRPERGTWEYLVWDRTDKSGIDTKKFPVQLDSLGSQGWELVQIAIWPMQGGGIVILKRRAQ